MPDHKDSDIDGDGVINSFDKLPKNRSETLDNDGDLIGDVADLDGPFFAYSLPVHSFHTPRDRVASLTTCRLRGAAIQRASPLGLGRALTLPCGWNNAGGQVQQAGRQAVPLVWARRVQRREREGLLQVRAGLRRPRRPVLVYPSPSP